MNLRLGLLVGFVCCLAAVAPRSASAAVEITSGNDTLDDTTTIVNALTTAKNTGTYVLAHAGTYYHSGVISIDGVELRGEGDTTVITATDTANSALRLIGTGPKLTNLKVQSSYAGAIIANSPDRLQSNASTAVCVDAATNFVIDNVTVVRGRCAGIMVNNSSGTAANPGLIVNNRVSDTLADGIHMTNKSHHILVQNNTVTNTQDDKIAIVSYVGNGGVCNNIGINNNRVYDGNWGRGIAIVGGDHVSVTNNLAQGISGSGIFLYSDGASSYNTYAASAVTMTGNTVRDCNMPPVAGSNAIMVSGRPEYLAHDIALSGNTVLASGNCAVFVKYAQRVSIANLTVDGVTQGGLGVMNSEDVKLESVIPGVCSIKNTGQNGVYADGTCTGYFKVSGVKFEQINQTGESWRDVIFVGNGAGLLATIVGNDYRNPSTNPINRYIECQSAYTTPISPPNIRVGTISSLPTIFCP